MNILELASSYLPVLPYSIAMTIVISSSYFLLHQFREQSLPLTRVRLRRTKQKLGCLPKLSLSTKAMLVLVHGADAWLPYMIPLHSHLTILGSEVSARSINSVASRCPNQETDQKAKQDIYLECLHSLSIDQEHCEIYTENDRFIIFDRARFNNTLVNQTPVPPEGRILVTGSVITLGAVTYMFVANQNGQNH